MLTSQGKWNVVKSDATAVKNNGIMSLSAQDVKAYGNSNVAGLGGRDWRDWAVIWAHAITAQHVLPAAGDSNIHVCV